MAHAPCASAAAPMADGAAVAAPMADGAAVAAPTMSYKPVMLTSHHKWALVDVVSMMTISGGFNGKAREVVPTTSFQVPGIGMMPFVELNKNTYWLMKLAKGKGCVKRGSLSRSLICDTLRARVKAITDKLLKADDTSPTAVAEEDGPSDPMDALIVSAPPEVHPDGWKTRASRQSKRKRDEMAAQTVHTLDVDMHPPMTKTSRNSKLDVRVVHVPSTKTNTARGGVRMVSFRRDCAGDSIFPV